MDSVLELNEVDSIAREAAEKHLANRAKIEASRPTTIRRHDAVAGICPALRHPKPTIAGRKRTGERTARATHHACYIKKATVRPVSV